MSITNELRESVKQTCWAMTSKAKWFAIADRIDIEHERELDYVRNLASEGLAEQWNSGYDVGFASADDWLEQHEDAMAEHGYIKLSKDADGVLIHIGDRMEHIDLEYVLEVIAVGIDCFIAWNTHLNRYCQYDNKLFRHHHEPTIEDVLREFAGTLASAENNWGSNVNDAIAEYAAKLQLKAQ